jgi:CRAL/TRIO domain
MGQLIIINAPTCFTAIWSVIKPWLAPRTLDKISILGASQPDQHATLLELVSPENLPVALGGTCTCSCPPTDSTDSTNSTTASSRSDSDVDSDSDCCSGSGNGSAGAGGGCTLSNAGPWMDDRAERRARWLRGEIPKPGVPWPPLQKQEEQEQEQEQAELELEQERHAAEETRDGDENVEEAGAEAEAEAVPIDAPVASSDTTCVAAAPPSSSSASCSRTSVAGLPQLTHPPAPAPVRLVV